MHALWLEKSGISWMEEQLIPERTFDIVVDATGSAEGFYLARRAVRPGGTIVLKSTYHGNLEVDFASVVVDEITLIGSRCGSFIPALGLLEDKRVETRDLIDDRYALKDALGAYRRAAQPGSLKVLLEP